MLAEAICFETGTGTHVGRVRTLNEDRFLVRPDIGVFAVADGMGGHDRGEVASSLVVRALDGIGHAGSAAELLGRFEERILTANGQLQRLAGGGDAVIGTTVAALLVHSGYYACVWSGDSRVYLVRDGRIAALSRDHTEAQEMVDEGVLSPEEARSWPRRNVVTRAIGVHDRPEVELEQGQVLPGDLFVLCSDGLTNHVSDEEILALVLAGPPQAACDGLIALTLERGASDNVTVVVVVCRLAERPPTRPASGRPTNLWE